MIRLYDKKTKTQITLGYDTTITGDPLYISFYEEVDDGCHAFNHLIPEDELIELLMSSLVGETAQTFIKKSASYCKKHAPKEVTGEDT